MNKNEILELDRLLSELVLEVARLKLGKAHIQNITDVRQKTVSEVLKKKGL